MGRASQLFICRGDKEKRNNVDDLGNKVPYLRVIGSACLKSPYETNEKDSPNIDPILYPFFDFKFFFNSQDKFDDRSINFFKVSTTALKLATPSNFAAAVLRKS